MGYQRLEIRDIPKIVLRVSVIANLAQSQNWIRIDVPSSPFWSNVDCIVRQWLFALCLHTRQ